MTQKPATYADLEALPSDKIGELIGGVLYASPRPTMSHGRAASHLYGELYGPFGRGGGDGPGGWHLIFEPELHLGDDVLVPDLAGWRRERVPELPSGVGVRIAPDWVCEVLSPSTAALDRDRKMTVYAREGVRHVWLIDPKPRTLEVFRLEDSRYVPLATHAGGAIVRAEPFDVFSLELRVLWGV
ncbi:Uma2 family endonuclease [Pyxidicoccus fallax]|uniref:Uma2 family endonuclease n=1 Tax=Pyxidicoccus fallax TaxID=394095 RepID=A0A848LET7_9BACT|nr:Uma2 family endonuclease [Pyxidicoccus fallax]NMO14008.1 Uma2 family endonuclease [Pyxidicoccus fallax]NPC76660.1 Uma2 family endonuclease [Pyxidicoccus fallax]